MGHFPESGGGEDAATADEQLTPCDVAFGIRDHRVAIEGARAASAGEVDRGGNERPTDADPTEAAIERHSLAGVLNHWHWQ